jgi:hypothetical protein
MWPILPTLVTLSHKYSDLETLVPDAWLSSALPTVASVLSALLQRREPRPPTDGRSAAMLDSAIYKHWKLLCTAVQCHPWALEASGALNTGLECACAVLCRSDAGGLSWLRIAAKAMAFISHTFTSPAYQCKVQVVTLQPQERCFYT